MEKLDTLKGNFDFIVPTVVPSFVKGQDAKTLLDKVSKTIKSGIWYDADSRTIKGSNSFLNAVINTEVRPLGIRVVNLRDLSRPEVMKMIEGNHYSDTPAIVFRTMEDGYEQNNLLIKKLAQQVEHLNGKLQLPVLVTGFDVVPSEDKKGYGLEIVPRDDFAALHDERLSGKYDSKRFSNIDENGLPIFDKNGSRTWHTRNEGLSGFCLNRGLNLGYYGGDLAYSDWSGRVVLVRDVACEGKK